HNLCASREEGIRKRFSQKPDDQDTTALACAMESSAEIDRIRGVYRDYAERGYAESKWSSTNKGNILTLCERQRRIRELLEETGFLPLISKRILDVGCGCGELLRTFKDWGAQSKNLCGVDLIPDRIR